MRAEYVTEADALSIGLVDAPLRDESISIDDTYCHLAVSKGVPVNIELLSPSRSLHFLDAAANSQASIPQKSRPPPG